MREIKFRAWEENTKKMIEDVHYDKELAYDINPWIFMQYTGLHDKNGKEIYEKDTVKTETDATYLVLWDKDAAAFRYLRTELYEEDDAMIDSESPLNYDNVEVIGNIYENPTLLSNPQSN